MMAFYAWDELRFQESRGAGKRFGKIPNSDRMVISCDFWVCDFWLHILSFLSSMEKKTSCLTIFVGFPRRNDMFFLPWFHVLHTFLAPLRNPVAASDVNFQLTIVNTLLDRLVVHESG